jgi:hypothetical protein
MKPRPNIAPSMPKRLARSSGGVMSATYALATDAFDCIAPLKRRTTISIQSAVASAVTKKLSESAQKPTSSTGRRPKRSESAPSTGDEKKLAKLNANVTAPYHHACAVCDAVKLPTRAGSTGTIRPIDTMSISTVTMMNGIAARRLPASSAGAGVGLVPVIRRGNSALPS